MQLSLFTFPNPLKERLGKEFFSTIPKLPGVYFLCDEQGTILYVGKAKSLHSRLMSYQRVKKEGGSRKVNRLVHRVHHIRWEVLANEYEALVRENELLRTLRPEFNEANTRPDTYFLIAMSPHQDIVQLRLTMQEQDGPEKLFGRFKGRSRTYRSFGAVYRLLWAHHFVNVAKHLEQEFEYPLQIIRQKKLSDFSIFAEPSLMTALEKFLIGREPAGEGNDAPFVAMLEQQFLKIEKISPFYRNWLNEDLALLRSFYLSGPRWNYSVASQSLVTEHQIDDLVILERFTRAQLPRTKEQLV